MKHIHFIGIGGSGLSAIARLLQQSGYKVTGSDRSLSPFALDLQQQGVDVFAGHQASHVIGADLVIRSSAIPEDNPEVLEALRLGIPVYKRSDFLGGLMADRIGIAVAGTHGKTTTTAMISWILFSLDCDPSFIVGGTLNNLGVNARAGKGAHFVIEADEYDRMFLGLKPQVSVITNLEHDHPDCYPTFADMASAFHAFVDLLPSSGTLVACADDSTLSSLVAYARTRSLKVVSYAIRSNLTVDDHLWMQADSVLPNTRGGFDFSVSTNIPTQSATPLQLSLQVPGEHNVQNALAALSVTAVLGLPLERATQALADFTGTGRRFEIQAEVKGITFIDDYAHHPTEIRATLAGAKARYPGRRIWAVWQPHTYSRTQTLFDAFSRAFNDADCVLVTEIYASREARRDFSSAAVVAAMSHPAAHFGGSLAESTDYLLQNLSAGDVLIVLSAGDADYITAEVIKRLSQ